MKVVDVPIRVDSKSNGSHMHWSRRHRINVSQRRAVASAALLIRGAVAPCTITLTRCGKRQMDDDNLRDALKAVRDEVAAQLGFRNDADPQLTWKYAQKHPAPYGVRIEIQEAPDAVPVRR